VHGFYIDGAVGKDKNINGFVYIQIEADTINVIFYSRRDWVIRSLPEAKG
jgi:hypothetical protein